MTGVCGTPCHSSLLLIRMDRELKEPSDGFLRFMVHEIYSGKIVHGVLERFRPADGAAGYNRLKEGT